MERRDRGLPRDHPKISRFDRVINFILVRIFPFRDILKELPTGESLYLRRWFIKKGDGGSGRFIHYFARSDDDRHPHDHPWPFKVFILNKGYYEEDVRGVEHWCPPWKWRSCTADWYHRVHLTEGPVWTIFTHGPKEKDWGFLVDGNWVQHSEYCKVTGSHIQDYN